MWGEANQHHNGLWAPIVDGSPTVAGSSVAPRTLQPMASSPTRGLSCLGGLCVSLFASPHNAHAPRGAEGSSQPSLALDPGWVSPAPVGAGFLEGSDPLTGAWGLVHLAVGPYHPF